MLNSCVSCSLDNLRYKLEFKSRIPIPEFSGYQCRQKMRSYGTLGKPLSMHNVTEANCYLGKLLLGKMWLGKTELGKM